MRESLPVGTIYHTNTPLLFPPQHPTPIPPYLLLLILPHLLSLLPLPAKLDKGKARIQNLRLSSKSVRESLPVWTIYHTNTPLLFPPQTLPPYTPLPPTTPSLPHPLIQTPDRILFPHPYIGLFPAIPTHSDCTARSPRSPRSPRSLRSLPPFHQCQSPTAGQSNLSLQWSRKCPAPRCTPPPGGTF